MNYENAREILDLQLGGAENARQILTEKFSDAPFVAPVKRQNYATGEEQEVKVLTADFLATYRILQKHKGNLYAAFKKEVRLKWNTDFGREDFSLLENYLKFIRYFSPPIYQEATMAFDFRKTIKAGAIGLDLAQIGALATAKLMANLAGIEDTDHALLGAQESSADMAMYIKKQHQQFQEFWLAAGGPAEGAEIEISGDDLVIYPPKKISDGQINAYLHYLTSLKNSWGLRTVILRQAKFQETNEEISPEDISAILIGAEDLQKYLMRELLQALPSSVLRQTAMVIEVLPYRAGLKTYRVIIALPKALVNDVGDALVAIQSSEEWANEYGATSNCRLSFNLRTLPAPKGEDKLKEKAKEDKIKEDLCPLQDKDIYDPGQEMESKETKNKAKEKDKDAAREQDKDKDKIKAKNNKSAKGPAKAKTSLSA
ncbi:MAG: hypothetical protein J6Y94_06015 [Bacteriovoracaceae bacterium]|nr:hypothetical protein [Bacteriovoracaceae bacterium]